MNYGDKATTIYKDWFTGEIKEHQYTYRFTSWKGFHTNNMGQGLWVADKQIVGTCDFSVAGCNTLKTAKDKIRRWVRKSPYYGAEV